MGLYQVMRKRGPVGLSAGAAAQIRRIEILAKKPGSTLFLEAVAVLAITFATLSGCGRSDPPVTEPAVVSASNITLFTDTSNPLLMEFTPSNGKPTTIYGAKDVNGLATSVTGMAIASPTSVPRLITLDAQGRPGKVSLEDGSTLSFSWQTSSQFVVSVVTGDGKTKTDVPLDLTQSAAVPAKAASASSRIANGAPAALGTNNVNGTVQVSVTEGGLPVTGATVWANIVPQSLGVNGNGYNLPLSEVAAGQYDTSFVNFPSAISPSALTSSCNSIVSTTTKTCQGLIPVATVMIGPGCATLATIVSAAATPVAGAAILLICDSVFADALAGCTAVKVAVPSGTSEGLCQSIASTVSFFDPDGVFIKATATLDGKSGAANAQFGGNTTLAVLNIALPATTTLTVTADAKTIQSSTGNITFTATVSGGGSGAPTGSVVFVDQNGTMLCSAAPLASGLATCSTAIQTGPDTVSATYSGDTAFASSTGNVTVYNLAGTWDASATSATAPPITGSYNLTQSGPVNGSPVQFESFLSNGVQHVFTGTFSNNTLVFPWESSKTVSNGTQTFVVFSHNVDHWQVVDDNTISMELTGTCDFSIPTNSACNYNSYRFILNRRVPI